jgi:hypothetical protein
MLGKTTYVSSVLKKRIFPLLNVANLGIVPPILQFKMCTYWYTDYKPKSPCKRREGFSIRFDFSLGRLSP